MMPELLTHLSMLTQNTNKVKLMEAKQNDQLVLCFTIISCLLHTIRHNLRTKYTQTDEKTNKLNNYSNV